MPCVTVDIKFVNVLKKIKACGTPEKVERAVEIAQTMAVHAWGTKCRIFTS